MMDMFAMRKIKFRGMRVSNNKFIYGYLVLNQTNNTFIAKEAHCDNYNNPSTSKSSIELIEVFNPKLLDNLLDSQTRTEKRFMTETYYLISAGLISLTAKQKHIS